MKFSNKTPDGQDIDAIYMRQVVPLYEDTDPGLYEIVKGDGDRLRYYCGLADLEISATENRKFIDIGAGISGFGPLIGALGGDVCLVDDFGGGGGVEDETKDQIDPLFAAFKTKFDIDIHRQQLLSEPLNFDDNSIDIVSSFHCFEHFHHSPKFLMEEIVRVLVPGGLFILGTPNAVNLRKRISLLRGRTNLGTLDEFYHEGFPEFRGHVREPTVQDLRTLCDWNGLKVETISGANFLALHSRTFESTPAVLRGAYRLMMNHLLPAWPGLCSDIHVVARKPASV